MFVTLYFLVFWIFTFLRIRFWPPASHTAPYLCFYNSKTITYPRSANSLESFREMQKNSPFKDWFLALSSYLMEETPNTSISVKLWPLTKLPREESTESHGWKNPSEITCSYKRGAWRPAGRSPRPQPTAPSRQIFSLHPQHLNSTHRPKNVQRDSALRHQGHWGAETEVIPALKHSEGQRGAASLRGSQSNSWGRRDCRAWGWAERTGLPWAQTGGRGASSHPLCEQSHRSRPPGVGLGTHRWWRGWSSRNKTTRLGQPGRFGMKAGGGMRSMATSWEPAVEGSGGLKVTRRLLKWVGVCTRLWSGSRKDRTSVKRLKINRGEIAELALLAAEFWVYGLLDRLQWPGLRDCVFLGHVVALCPQGSGWPREEWLLWLFPSSAFNTAGSSCAKRPPPGESWKRPVLGDTQSNSCLGVSPSYSYSPSFNPS